MIAKPVMAVAPCRGRARAPSRAARTQSASRLTSGVVRISHHLALRGRPSSHFIISPITHHSAFWQYSGTTRGGGAVRAVWVSARVRIVDPPVRSQSRPSIPQIAGRPGRGAGAQPRPCPRTLLGCASIEAPRVRTLLLRVFCVSACRSLVLSTSPMRCWTAVGHSRPRR